jgi:4-hydroxybenzoate polyprenyltransferase
MVPPHVLALRPHQWSKNLFVLAALVFAVADRTATVVVDDATVVRVVAAFFAFCLGASAIYLVNDIVDVENDRRHPEKRNRPIASGRVSLATARWMALGTALAAALLGALAGGEPIPVLAVLAGYVALNVAYSLGLKRVVLVDAFCIATGFLLRVVAGGFAAHAAVSHWLLLCTLFLALLLALGKRRSELALLGDGGTQHRASLKSYDVGFLDQMVTLLAAVTVVCYTMYTLDEETARKFGSGRALIVSVPFVVFGIGRYLLLLHTGHQAGNPTRLFLGGDALFLANLVLWAVAVFAALSGHVPTW